MFWAGDTAQQVTATAFRFEELKDLWHGLEVTFLTASDRT